MTQVPNVQAILSLLPKTSSEDETIVGTLMERKISSLLTKRLIRKDQDKSWGSLSLQSREPQ